METIDLRQCRVLLVDDLKANINILNMTLSNEYDIDSVCDGESALRYVESNETDLILLDVVMPGIDGYEVCRRLKGNERTRDIPIIFITSMDDEDDESSGLELGAVDYITKPFSRPIVRARVRNHLIMKKQRDLLHSLSNMDGLTSIPNRRSFDRCLDIEWRQAIRLGAPLSVIMIDVDFFKNYNDAYGHTAGDDCLTRTAQALKSSLRRPRDYIARYGGEEFVALLPGIDDGGAGIVATAMRDSIEALGIPHSHSTAASHVTISLGAATVVPPRDMDPLLLIQAADKALYRAKDTGRNRSVCVAL
jgi:diguanylate cyclase (GGDEF)-like protein